MQMNMFIEFALVV